MNTVGTTVHDVHVAPATLRHLAHAVVVGGVIGGMSAWMRERRALGMLRRAAHILAHERRLAGEVSPLEAPASPAPYHAQKGTHLEREVDRPTITSPPLLTRTITAVPPHQHCDEARPGDCMSSGRAFEHLARLTP